MSSSEQFAIKLCKNLINNNKDFSIEQYICIFIMNNIYDSKIPSNFKFIESIFETDIFYQTIAFLIMRSLQNDITNKKINESNNYIQKIAHDMLEKESNKIVAAIKFLDVVVIRKINSIEIGRINENQLKKIALLKQKSIEQIINELLVNNKLIINITTYNENSKNHKNSSNTITDKFLELHIQGAIIDDNFFNSVGINSSNRNIFKNKTLSDYLKYQGAKNTRPLTNTKNNSYYPKLNASLINFISSNVSLLTDFKNKLREYIEIAKDIGNNPKSTNSKQKYITYFNKFDLQISTANNVRKLLTPAKNSLNPEIDLNDLTLILNKSITLSDFRKNFNNYVRIIATSENNNNVTYSKKIYNYFTNIGYPLSQIRTLLSKK